MTGRDERREEMRSRMNLGESRDAFSIDERGGGRRRGRASGRDDYDYRMN